MIENNDYNVKDVLFFDSTVNLCFTTIVIKSFEESFDIIFMLKLIDFFFLIKKFLKKFPKPIPYIKGPLAFHYCFTPFFF